ncbi:MAG: formyltransferase family protein [Desulfovibrionaceae bacterium]
MFPTYYFGRTTAFAEHLLFHYDLQGVFSDFFCPDLYTFCCLSSISYRVISKTTQMDSMQIIPNALGICHCYTRIFKQNHIDFFTHGIWNIHPGLLPLYRGKHPIEWAFYNNERYIGLSIHSINTEIDKGRLLAQTRIERLFSHSLDDIEKEVERVVIQYLLADAFKTYLAGDTNIILEDGIYLPSFLHIIDSFSIEKHSQKEVLMFFVVQKSYTGITLRGKHYTECLPFHQDFPEYFEGYDIYTCADGLLVAVR